MKKIIATVALASAIPVHAGNYTEAVQQQQVCEVIGKMSYRTYVWRERGLTLDQAVKSLKGTPSPTGTDDISLAYIAMESAFAPGSLSASDAQVNAWAKCMDRLTGQ